MPKPMQTAGTTKKTVVAMPDRYSDRSLVESAAADRGTRTRCSPMVSTMYGWLAIW